MVKADIFSVQTKQRYEADMKRIQEAREGLPAVETVLGLDEMQVGWVPTYAGTRGPFS